MTNMDVGHSALCFFAFIEFVILAHGFAEYSRRFEPLTSFVLEETPKAKQCAKRKQKIDTAEPDDELQPHR